MTAKSAPPTDRQAEASLAYATHRSQHRAGAVIGISPGVLGRAAKGFVRRSSHITAEQAAQWREAFA